jgi:hypothetical protein
MVLERIAGGSSNEMMSKAGCRRLATAYQASHSHSHLTLSDQARSMIISRRGGANQGTRCRRVVVRIEPFIPRKQDGSGQPGESLGEIHCQLSIASSIVCVGWMMMVIMMMMMTLHHGLPQITACLKALLSAGPRWCSVDSRASVTPPHIGACRPGGRQR